MSEGKSGWVHGLIVSAGTIAGLLEAAFLGWALAGPLGVESSTGQIALALIVVLLATVPLAILSLLALALVILAIGHGLDILIAPFVYLLAWFNRPNWRTLDADDPMFDDPSEEAG